MIDDISKYIEAYDIAKSLTAEMLEWSKKYVTDKKIDVWQRWNFFCSIAIRDEPNSWVYHNDAMDEEERNIIFGIRYVERRELIRCVDRFIYLFENFEIDDSESQHVKDNWMADQITLAKESNRMLRSRITSPIPFFSFFFSYI